MKSHFQRSDGFDACSQCCAETGRPKRQRRRSPCSPACRQRRGDVARARAADARVGERHAERRREVDENLPVFQRVAGRRRSRATRPARGPGRWCRTRPSRRTMRRAARSRRPRASSVSSTPWTISSGSLPLRARVDDPATCRRSSRPGPGRRRRAPHLAGLDRGSQRRQVRPAPVVADWPGAKPRSARR